MCNLHFPVPSMNRLNQTEPATFSILPSWAFFRDSVFLYLIDKHFNWLHTSFHLNYIYIFGEKVQKFLRCDVSLFRNCMFLLLNWEISGNIKGPLRTKKHINFVLFSSFNCFCNFFWFCFVYCHQHSYNEYYLICHSKYFFLHFATFYDNNFLYSTILSAGD
jgi:hypothetical protein